MSFKGNQIALGNLSPSLKQMLEDLSGGSGSGFKEIEPIPASTTPDKWEEGYTVFYLDPLHPLYTGWLPVLSMGTGAKIFIKIETTKKGNLVQQYITIFGAQLIKENPEQPNDERPYFPNSITRIDMRMPIPSVSNQVVTGYKWLKTQVFPSLIVDPPKNNPNMAFRLGYKDNSWNDLEQTISGNVSNAIKFNASEVLSYNHEISSLFPNISPGIGIIDDYLQHNSEKPVEFLVSVEAENSLPQLDFTMIVYGSFTDAMYDYYHSALYIYSDSKLIHDMNVTNNIFKEQQTFTYSFNTPIIGKLRTTSQSQYFIKLYLSHGTYSDVNTKITVTAKSSGNITF